MSEITALLSAAAGREGFASEELLPLVYDELRRLASGYVAGESAGHTLQPTALVHEAWLRLVRSEDRTWQNRTHFFRAAAQAMRHILVNRAIVATAGTNMVLVPLTNSVRFFRLSY